MHEKNRGMENIDERKQYNNEKKDSTTTDERKQNTYEQKTNINETKDR